MQQDISRERIRSRMIKNAAQIWGVQVSDINAFDPVVNMLFGAFSSEMEKVYNEIESSHSRVLERLSKLLIPEVNNGPVPAHGIMHARANDHRTTISKNTQFYFHKKVPSPESSLRETFRDLYFTPVTDVVLFNGDIQYFAYDNAVFSNLDTIHKEKVLESRTGKRIPANTLWLGINLHDQLDSLNGLSFYFDWVTGAERDYFTKFLPSTQWWLNGIELQAISGINTAKQQSVDELLDPDIEFDPAKNIESDTLNFYNDRFISVNLPRDYKGGLQSLTTKIPDELKAVFNEVDMAFIQKKLFWLKVQFPPSLSPDVVDNAFCCINAFPAINRKFNEQTFRLQPQFNIIPLNADADHFFSMLSVKSSDGTSYTGANMADTHKISPGMYVVRKGGVERFDTRNAAEILNYMVELLRDESAAFAIFGRDAIAADLRELNQNLNLISQKLDKTSDDLSPVSYLVLKSRSANEVVFIEYWTTAGEFANNQKNGTKLVPVSGSSVSNEHLMLLSNTIGGRNNLSDSETLGYFKNALLSRNRVVSEADIRYVCHRELGNLIQDVQIKPGIEIDSDSKSGFRRTVEVEVIPSNPMNPSIDEWQSLCKNLQVKLEKGSAVLLPIRVKLRKK